jgi:hypothetical protein
VLQICKTHTVVAIITVIWILWLVRFKQVLGQISYAIFYNVVISIHTSNVEVFDPEGSSRVNAVKI